MLGVVFFYITSITTAGLAVGTCHLTCQVTHLHALWISFIPLYTVNMDSSNSYLDGKLEAEFAWRITSFVLVVKHSSLSIQVHAIMCIRFFYFTDTLLYLIALVMYQMVCRTLQNSNCLTCCLDSFQFTIIPTCILKLRLHHISIHTKMSNLNVALIIALFISFSCGPAGPIGHLHISSVNYMHTLMDVSCVAVSSF